MNRAKKYSLPEVFNNVSLGFTFEFYSSKRLEFIVENLGKLTAKDIAITNSTDFQQPSYDTAVLVQEYEGTKPRYSFSLAQQRYDSIIPLMKEVLRWISETSECRQDNVMRVNMSFDHRHLKTLSDLSHMNPQKLILKLDEEYIYERFPDQEDSPYAMSVKRLLPLSEAQYTPDLIKNINYIIGVPKEKYYGINFAEYHRGILEFNYIGGLDYSEKEKEILETIQYYVIKTYQSLNEREFTKEEVKELEKLTNDYHKIHEAYDDPEKFKQLYPNIDVAVDMRRDSQFLKTYWPVIRNTLFNTIINNKLSEGQFNLDRDFGIYQLRRANISSSGLKGFDLVQCEVSGVIVECNLISCEVNNARIYNSKIVKGNDVFDSYLHKVTVDKDNLLERCFLENEYELLNCEIKESVLKFAGLGKSAHLDEGTVLIDNQKTYEPVIGVESEEIKDVNWFKNLLGKQPESYTFGNEFIKKTYI